MRLYSLRQSKHFHHFNSPTKLDPPSSTANYSSIVTYLTGKVTRVINSQGRCFLTICDESKSRTSQVVFEEGSLDQLFINGQFAIVRCENGQVGWLDYRQMEKRCKIYEVSKLILSKSSCNWIKEISEEGSKYQNMQIIACKNGLVLLQTCQDSIKIWRYSNRIELESLIVMKFDIATHFTVKSIIIDENYDDKGPVCFIITVTIEHNKTESYICEIDGKQYQLRNLPTVSSSISQQGLRLCRMSSDLIVLLCDQQLVLLERNQQKVWIQLVRLVPEGKVSEMLECEGLLVTQEKCSDKYCVFKYDLKLVIAMKRFTPALLAESQSYKPLCLVTNLNKLPLILWGTELYLLRKSMFLTTAIINDYQFRLGKEPRKDEKDDSELVKTGKSFKDFRLKPQIIKQLSDYSRKWEQVKQLQEILEKLGIIGEWECLSELISEYLTNFLYISQYICALRDNKVTSALVVLPSKLEDLIHAVKEIFSQGIYSHEELKVEVTGINIFHLISISKIAHHMTIVAEIALKSSKKVTLGLKLLQLFHALFNQQYLVEYLLFKIKTSFCSNDVQGYHNYIKILSQLLRDSHDYHPLIYLLTNNPLQYYINSCHVQRINKMIISQLEQNEERIDFLKKELVQSKQYERYHSLDHIHAFSLQTQNSQSIDPANIYVKVNYDVKNRDFQAEPPNKNGELGNIKLLHHIGQSFIEIHEEEVFCMIQDKSQEALVGLSCTQSNKLLSFIFRLRLLNTRVLKLIHLQHQQSERASKRNRKVPIDCKLISAKDKQDKQLDFVSYKRKRRPIVVEEQNLIDQLLQDYLLHIDIIYSDFHLSFSGHYSEKKKQLEFSKLLKEERLDISEITREEEIFYPDKQQILEKQAEGPYLAVINEVLWELYQSLVDVQQNSFEVYEHIREKQFVQRLLAAQEEGSVSSEKRLKEQALHFLTSRRLKNYKDFLLKLKHQRKNYRITLREKTGGKARKQLWLKMIDFCNRKEGRWLGDPFDLLEEVIQVSFSLSEAQCKSITEVILALFTFS